MGVGIDNSEVMLMIRCESCGNWDDKSFTIQLGGQNYAFDCFDCAIESLAWSCAYCRKRILGHGVENNGKTFCSSKCVKASELRQACERYLRVLV